MRVRRLSARLLGACAAACLSVHSGLATAEVSYDNTVDGTEAGEQLLGSSGSDLIKGLGGNDTIFAFGGNDRLLGGEGEDRLQGGNGSRTGSGNDELVGGPGKDVLMGEDGDDTLEGGSGGDHFYYTSGQDTIIDPEADEDILFFLAAAKSDLSFHQSGDDLLVRVKNDAANTVTVQSFFAGEGHQVHVQPNGGFMIPANQINGLLTPIDGDDTGGDGSSGDTGGDSGSGSGSDDGSSGGDGSDGDSELTVTVAGSGDDEFLLGDAENDVILGDKGDDILVAQAGDDTYVIRSGDGQDRIIDTTGRNIIRFDSSITFSDVSSGFMRSGDHLTLRIGQSGQSVTIHNFFTLAHTVSALEFSSGQNISADQMFGIFGVNAPEAEQSEYGVYFGSGIDNALQGTTGRDILVTGQGSDQLRGLADDDLLLGGVGDDTYEILPGNGRDILIDASGQNIIHYPAGTNYNDIGSNLRKQGDDLILAHGNEQDSVRILEFFKRSSTIERVTFETGGELTAEQLISIFNAAAPSNDRPIMDRLSEVGPGETDPEADGDRDGLSDAADVCPFTPANETVNQDGCAASQLDTDNDGVDDATDQCTATLPEWEPNDVGCAPEQLDTDGDTVNDAVDQCDNTPDGVVIDEFGCHDSDGDGVFQQHDSCPQTRPGEEVDNDGCALYQKDTDHDDVNDAIDQCSDTSWGKDVNDVGCALYQLDTDEDGITDDIDQCSQTDPTTEPDDRGCAPYQRDTDGDGQNDHIDEDDDGDGYADTEDDFPLDSTEHNDLDTDGIGDNADTDDDGDGYSDSEEVEAGTDPRDWQSNNWYSRELRTRVPRTGERLSHFEGDDGDLRVGAPKVLRRDHDKEIVHDLVNGLVWLDNESAETPFGWNSSAERHCRNMEHAGITDWRIPNRLEMQFLMDYYKTSLDDTRISSVFKHHELHINSHDPYGYMVEELGNLHNAINFGQGRIVPQNWDWSGHVRCVSGPQTFIPDMRSLEDEGVTIDVTNKLMWQDNAEIKGDEHDVQSAINYCENLTLSGHNDWRLPNANESLTLLYEFDRYSRDDHLPSSFNYVPGNDKYYGLWLSSTSAYEYDYVQGHRISLPHTSENRSGNWAFRYRAFGANYNRSLIDMYHQVASAADENVRCVRTYAEPTVDIQNIPEVVNVGGSIELDASSSKDPDGSIASYEWWDLNQAGVVGTESVYALDNVQGDSIRLWLTVTDTDGLKTRYDHDITIGINHSPTVAVEGNRRISVGEPLTLSAEASSDDYGIADYSWERVTDSLEVSQASSLSLDDLSIGQHDYRLTITDDYGLTSSDVITVTVFSPPVISVSDHQSVYMDDDDGAVISASESHDPDGSVQAYEWRDTLSGSVLSTGPQLNISDLEPGNYSIALTVWDDQNNTATLTQPLAFRVNEPPTPTVEGQSVVRLGLDVSLSAANSTDDTGIADYVWLDRQSGDVLSNSAILDLARPDQGTHSITLKVTDADGATASRDIDVEVTAYPPEIIMDSTELVALVGTSVAFDASASQDRDGNIVSYQWTHADGIEVLSDKATFEVSDIAFGEQRYQLTVTDDSGLETEQTVTLKVGHAPQAHIAQPGTIYEGAHFALDGSGSRIDEGIIGYEWYQDGVPVSQNAKALIDGLDAGEHTFELVVTSELGFTDQAEHVVTVIDSRPLQACPAIDVESDHYHEHRYPDNDIVWTGGDAATVEDIQAAFNHARLNDPSVHEYLIMPPQSDWDAMSLQEKGLYLVNAERMARGIKPYEAYVPEVNDKAQYYADFILDNNQPIGHYNDGRSPMQRLDSSEQILNNRDAHKKVESVASATKSEPVTEDYALARAVYGWIYEDKAWFEDFDWATGPAWGHRDHLLQTGLNENSHSPYAEGLIGFGQARGHYMPGGNPSDRYGAVTVFKTIDQKGDWSLGNTGTTVGQTALGCIDNHALELDVPSTETDGLVRLSLTPESLLMATGGTAEMIVEGHYADGATRDLTGFVTYAADKRSVVEVQSGVITARQAGVAKLYATVNGVDSNRVMVRVGEPADASGLVGTGVESFSQYIPDNATAQHFNPMALSVYTGLVTDRDGYPLSGVTVNVHGKPEYGSVQTDNNGRFTLAGPAGQQTLVYQKTGYVVVQRSLVGVSDSWNALETVTLLSRDSKQTFIDLSTGEPQVHQSSLVVDEWGQRKATVVFNGITSATIQSADGSERPVKQFWLGATEFETPESMPGELPEDSAFTWATDLKVSGTHYTDTVQFDGHVIMVVDNFLDFPLGEIVPIGYFDRNAAEWVASENGVVVQLVDSNNDGAADGLDYTGDGQPDDLTQDGTTTDEVIGLGSYQPGDMLWWGRFDHMTPVDYNWATDDALATPWYEWAGSVEDPFNEEIMCTGSYAKPYQQSFHEDIPITGTNLTLHYSSQRTEGYKHKINVTVSGDDVPASMNNMIARLEIAGRVFEEEFIPTPNVEAEFIWDGTRPDGTRPAGLVRGQISIGHEYPTTYMSNGNAARDGQSLSSYPTAWATVGDLSTSVPGRQAFVSWQRRGITLKNSFDRQLANGWSLSNLHEFDPKGTVYLGNGEVSEVASESLILKTGQTYAYSDGDDGYYQAGGSTVDYRIDSNGILVDEVTGLEWQYLEEPMLTTSKTQAINYCANEAEPQDSGWRLPTPKELGYTIEKSGANLGPQIYSLVQARRIWHENSVNTNNQLLTTVCVRGETLDSRTVAEFNRDAGKSVVVDGENGLMWQDDSSNTSVTVDWDGAIQHCEASNHAGYDDWRLPNINELLYALPNDVFEHQTSLPAGEVWNPTVDFRNPYWSSTTNLKDEDQAWAIESASYNSEQFLKNDAYHVRCVREASSALRMPFRFNKDGQHLETIDLDSGVTLTQFGYDSKGQIRTLTDRFGNTTTIHRDASGVPTHITTEDGFTTWLEVDNDGNLYEVRYEDNSRYRFQYKSGGLLTHKTDRRGFEYDRRYDENGRITKVSDPAGAVWEFFDQRPEPGQNQYGYTTITGRHYESRRSKLDDGAIRTVINRPNKTSTTHIRTEDGLQEQILGYGTTTVINKILDPKTEQPVPREATVTLPSGLELLTTYQKTYAQNEADTSRYTLTVDRNGRTSTVEIDAAAGLRTETSPEGRKAIIEQDPETLQLSRVSMSGLPDTVYDYDSRGRMIRTTVDERVVYYRYDDPNDHGMLSSVTQVNGKTTEFDYDVMGRLARTYLPGSDQPLEYGYDNNGNLNLIKLPSGELHAFDYTSRDKKEEYKPPFPDDSATDPPRSSDYPMTRYSYNLDKQLEDITRPDGSMIDYVYSSDTGRLESLHIPHGSYSYRYYGQNDEDKNGKIEAVVAPDGQKTEYSYDGSLLARVQWGGTVFGGLSYGYNEHFEPIRQTVNGDALSMSYNLDGQLVKIGSLTLAYQSENGLLRGTELNQSNTTRTYNAFGELKTYTVNTDVGKLYEYELQRDDAGQITGETETLGGTVTQYDYGYDSRGRLNEIRENGVITNSWRYDANGNRVSENGKQVATYDSQDRLTQYNEYDYRYTANGELTQKSNTQTNDTTLYVYDVFSNLRSVTMPDGTQIKYVIDGLNRRVAKLRNGTIVQGFLYQGQLNPVAELDGNNNVVSRFVYGDRSNVPAYMIKNNINYRIVSDHLGSVRLVVNASTGEVKQRMDYDAWGNVTNDTNPGFQPFGYAGGIYDRDTGLVRFGARDYEPEIGRWTTKDPIGFAGGLNHYAYVGNNPINFIDPEGLKTEVIIFEGVGWGSSSFGHVATNINGTIYSWGPSGMAVMSHQDYMDRNSFRNAKGLTLSLSPAQEAQLEQRLMWQQGKGSYGAAGYNCTDPLENGLEDQGYDLGINVTPGSLHESLAENGLIASEISYGRDPNLPAPGPYDSAPWAGW